MTKTTEFFSFLARRNWVLFNFGTRFAKPLLLPRMKVADRHNKWFLEVYRTMTRRESNYTPSTACAKEFTYNWILVVMRALLSLIKVTGVV